jgi:uncharacterized protein YegP (UPF0339 family)
MDIVYKEILYSRPPLPHKIPTKPKPAKTGRYEIFKDKAGEYRFRLKAPNGEIIAVSEGYKEKKSCIHGIESVKRNAASKIIDELGS